jgi:hypothetical protein
MIPVMVQFSTATFDVPVVVLTANVNSSSLSAKNVALKATPVASLLPNILKP